VFDHLVTNNLHCVSSDFNLLISEKPQVTAECHEKLSEMMFETLESKSVYSLEQSVLALVGIGGLSGLVFDSGESFSNFVFVYDAFSIPRAVVRSPLCGRFLSSEIVHLIAEREGAAVRPVEHGRCIKERCCCVALYHQTEALRHETFSSVLLPDRARSASRASRSSIRRFAPRRGGVHQNVLNSVVKSDTGIRQDLYKSILVCGGRRWSTASRSASRRMSSRSPPVDADPPLRAP
jgi:actin-related protein